MAHHNNQRHNDPLYCAGSSFRDNIYRAAIPVNTRYCAPELGTWMVCVACQKSYQNLETHANKHCGDRNALQRIHCGYIRQFQSGQAPPGVTTPFLITGALYNLVKRVYNLHPAYILANKEQVWGPYDPIPYRGFHAANPPAWVTVTPAAAAGGQPTIHVRSYDDLVREVIANFPPTMTTPPPEDHRMVGVRRALADPNRRSINHEMYVEDEKQARRTVALFMRENGNAARQAVMNQHPALGQWEQSDLHRSLVNVPQAAIVANPTVRLNLAPPGLYRCSM